MKPRAFLAAAVRNHTSLISIGMVLSVVSPARAQHANAGEINLGSANNFAVLAGSTITNTGSTVIHGGSLGLSPGTSITGFPPGIVDSPYVIEAADAAALQAEDDLAAAFNAAAALAPTENLTGTDLGGLTLNPGVYSFSSSAQLTGTLTLNDQGDPDAVFVFQIGSTLTTAVGSRVVTINDPSAPGMSVFWQVGSSATLGAGTDFDGNIMAGISITVDTGSTSNGRLLAEAGAVTLDSDTITAPPAENAAGGGGGLQGGGGGSPVPDAGATLLSLGLGLAILCAVRRRSTLSISEERSGFSG